MTNVAGQLETVDYRHAHVQQRNIRHTVLDIGQGLGGAVSDANVVAEQADQLAKWATSRISSTTRTFAIARQSEQPVGAAMLYVCRHGCNDAATDFCVGPRALVPPAHEGVSNVEKDQVRGEKKPARGGLHSVGWWRWRESNF